MKNIKRITALFLSLVMIFTMTLEVSSQEETGVVCRKTVGNNGDGTYDVDLTAYQSGVLMPLDIVMVLDVSGSMEYNVAVDTADIDPEKEYYIEYLFRDIIDGEEVIRGKKYKVSNTEGVWVANIEGQQVVATPIEPGTTPKEKGEYVFYTGAIDDLQAAATGFVHDIAKSAVENSLSHRIAVVEFSSSQKKSDSSLNTHAHSFYANILSGDKNPETALVSVAEKTDELESIFGSLTAEGPTYSDDALTQAENIFNANPSQDRQRVVVLFTDGGPGSYGWSSKVVDLDNSSVPTANAAIACANRMKESLDALIYTIGFFDANENDAAVDIKNKKYLAYISSNHTGATGMDDDEEPILGDYCYIDNSDSDLNTVFEKISTALGEGLDSVEIRDTVSRYFYMTDAQKKALKKAVPNAVITEMRDGTTGISVADTQLSQIMVDDNGNPVDENDSGIFKMSYSVTRKKDFIGGNGVPVGTADSGVYSDSGKPIAKCNTATASVDVLPQAVDALLSVNTPVIFEGEELTAEDFYSDMSDSWFADYAEVSYAVTDKDGKAFTSRIVTADDSGETFTVTVTAVIDGKSYSASESVSVDVTPDTVTGYEITENIEKTVYFVGDTLDTTGFELSEVYVSGKKLPVEDVTFSPTILTQAGTQKITVSCNGTELYFNVTVKAVVTQSVELVSAADKTTYFVGDTFDPEGIVLKVTKNNGTTETVTEGFECTPVQLATPGSRIVTITYDGKSVTMTVTVKKVEAQSIEIVSLPNNREFAYKQSPDFTGLSVKLTYNNGEEKTVTSLDKMTIKRVTKSDVRRGDIEFSVTAEGKSASFKMQSKILWWQWIILILLLGFIWY
ncbi:MAG: bacterial Ig-like domain-containing protein [Clostridia bacterium]|nr:bacterial Ig-like domain-containing protein [Clostridia bacterium]